MRRSRSTLNVRGTVTSMCLVVKPRSHSERVGRQENKPVKCLLNNKISEEDKQKIVRFLLQEYFENLKRRRQFLKELLKDTCSEKRWKQQGKHNEKIKTQPLTNHLNEDKENQHPNLASHRQSNKDSLFSSEIILQKFKDNLRTISDEIYINKRKLEISRERVARHMNEALVNSKEGCPSPALEKANNLVGSIVGNRASLSSTGKIRMENSPKVKNTVFGSEKKNGTATVNVKAKAFKTNLSPKVKEEKKNPGDILRDFKIKRNFLYVLAD
jgi:hypothetical protein